MSSASIAAAIASVTKAREALNTITTLLGLYAYLNPYTACVANNTSWDYIVVGGGTAGSTIASRLSENRDVKVLLIEAGNDADIESFYPSLLPFFSADMDWNYYTLPDKNYGKCHDTSKFKPTVTKVLGGDSSSDFMIYTQGEDRDYNKWAEMTGEPSWYYPNVLKLFKKLERFEDIPIKYYNDSYFHGFHGNVGLTKDRSDSIDKYLKAFEEIGKKVVRDINNNTKTGVTGAVHNIADNLRQNTVVAYLTPIKNSSNLFVLKDTVVTKILIDYNNNAKGVLAKKDKRLFRFKAEKEVIISAGPFNTPKLLQLSGIGDQKLLKSLNITVKSDLPVGKNYQDHVAVPVVIGADKTKAPFVREDFDYRFFPVNSFWNFDSLNKSNPYPECLDIVYIIKTTPPSILITYTSQPIYHYNNDIVNNWYKQLNGREVLYAYIQLAKMDSRGEVRIRSKHSSSPPTIDPRYLSQDSDIENLIKCIKSYLEILDSPMMKKSGAFFVDPTNGKCGKFGSDDFWRCYVKCLFSPQNHHVGTAALGSVVDGRMFVKGVKGLRVADASVFPELMTGSMLGPTIMLGEMAAEMVKEEWKRK